MFEKDFNLMVGRNLKRIRKERNLSVYKLAKELNRSVDAFYAYEEGTRTVPFQIIMELSKFYNISIDELVKNKVTTKRTKAVSFEIANSDSKDRVVIDSENDNIVFYKVDEWTYKYFLKCIDITLNKEVLIIAENKKFPAIISFDEKAKIYSVFNCETSTTTIYKYKKFHEGVVIIGEYAGTINKKIQVPNFL